MNHTLTATLRAVDYLRVSTEEQAKGYGIAYTGKKTNKHIAKKGWEHVGTYADEGVSGSLEAHQRKDLKRLMEDARSTPRPFDMVVVNEGRSIGRAFWRWVAERSEVNHEERAAELERQIAGQDAAISAAVVAAAKQPDAATAIKVAVAQLTEERTRLAGLLEEAKAWRAESEGAAQRARDLQALAEMARERLHDMAPGQQAEVLHLLHLLDVRVTVLGSVPVEVRSDDRVSGWFRSRDRVVPDLDDAAWALVESAFAAPRRGRTALVPGKMLEAILHKARTGCTWRALPEEYGPFGSVATAFLRWQRSGLWDRALEALSHVPGTPVPHEIRLPTLQVEGRPDPRLLIGTQATPGDTRSWQHDR